MRLTKRDESNANRLYYGKAFIYPLLAAPLVRLGLNGLLIFNVLLLAWLSSAPTCFSRHSRRRRGAALFTSAFFGAAALPIYGAFLMPDVFNLAVVLVAYFLWLPGGLRGCRPAKAGRSLRTNPRRCCVGRSVPL